MGQVLPGDVPDVRTALSETYADQPYLTEFVSAVSPPGTSTNSTLYRPRRSRRPLNQIDIFPVPPVLGIVAMSIDSDGVYPRISTALTWIAGIVSSYG